MCCSARPRPHCPSAFRPPAPGPGFLRRTRQRLVRRNNLVRHLGFSLGRGGTRPPRSGRDFRTGFFGFRACVVGDEPARPRGNPRSSGPDPGLRRLWSGPSGCTPSVPYSSKGGYLEHKLELLFSTRSVAIIPMRGGGAPEPARCRRPRGGPCELGGAPEPARCRRSRGAPCEGTRVGEPANSRTLAGASAPVGCPSALLCGGNSGRWDVRCSTLDWRARAGKMPAFPGAAGAVGWANYRTIPHHPGATHSVPPGARPSGRTDLKPQCDYRGRPVETGCRHRASDTCVGPEATVRAGQHAVRNHERVRPAPGAPPRGAGWYPVRSVEPRDPDAVQRRLVGRRYSFREAHRLLGSLRQEAWQREHQAEFSAAPRRGRPVAAVAEPVLQCVQQQPGASRQYVAASPRARRATCWSDTPSLGGTRGWGAAGLTRTRTCRPICCRCAGVPGPTIRPARAG